MTDYGTQVLESAEKPEGRERDDILNMTKFATFGDSYVTHLEKFTGGRSDVSNCRFFGVSGMSTRRKFQDKFDEMKHHRPDVVFMNLGGNDITESTDIQNLVKRLKNIVKELYENGSTKAIVATVIERGSFPEWTGLATPIFNKIRHKKLRTELGTKLIAVGKKMKYPRHYNNDLWHPGYQQEACTSSTNFKLDASTPAW